MYEMRIEQPGILKEGKVGKEMEEGNEKKMKRTQACVKTFLLGVPEW